MTNIQYVLDFHPLVASDYSDAFHWYEMQQKGLGDRLVLKIREKLLFIQQSPLTYGIKSKKGYHEALVGEFPYQIVYKVYKKESRIFVISIHHTKMNPYKKFRD